MNIFRKKRILFPYKKNKMEFLIFLMLIECVTLNIKPVYSTEIGAPCSLYWDCRSKTVDNLVCTESFCACDSGYKPVGTLCEPALDGNCTVDSDCTTYLSNSECTSNSCSCITAYKPDNNLCTAVYHGDCGQSSDCYTLMPNTKCDFHLLLCVCDTDYTYDSESVTCQGGTTTTPAPDSTTAAPIVLGSACTGTADCEVTNTVCTNNVCVCATGYKESSGTCAQVLDGSCSVDSDCSTAVSNSRCCNGTCLCSSGYKPENLVCETVYSSSCGSSPDCSTYMANIRCDFFLFLCLCSKGYTYNESTLVCDDDTGTASTSTVTYSSGCDTQTDNVATTVAATQTDNVERTYAASTDTGTTVGYGEQCSATSDCVAHSSCTRGTCSCNAGYRTNGTMCQKIIGGPCVYTSQCTYYEPNSNCIIGLCTCLDGYYETEVLCSKGAQAQTFSLLVVVAHVILVAMGT